MFLNLYFKVLNWIKDFPIKFLRQEYHELVHVMGYKKLTKDELRLKTEASTKRREFIMQQIKEQNDMEAAIVVEENTKKEQDPLYISFLDNKTQDEKDLILMLEAGRRLSIRRLPSAARETSNV